MYYVWDLETYPNIFLFTGKFAGEKGVFTFEISDRINQRSELMTHLSYIQNEGAIMVGYNNLGFDYPILHHLLTEPYTFDHRKASRLCQEIIQNQNGYGVERIRINERLIPQLDLMKLNHFDNANKRTSLKSLQFAMRAESVEDLPYDIRDLNDTEKDVLIRYNLHDVLETEQFFYKCKHLIDMRHELLNNGVIGGDVLNYSDVKIGIEYLIRKIGRAKCFSQGSTPKQTVRQFVMFKDLILSKIHYRTGAFNAVLDWFKEQRINIASDEERPSLETKLANLDFHFGLGGVHASVSNKYYESTETHVIRDVDVTGMYPSIAVANGFFPEHLGSDFTVAYKQLVKDRSQYPKGTAMNAVLKLASNGVYGNSNNPYSCFYDPKYTFSVTVNGQLQIIQLVEMLHLIPGLEIIQANTDGVTVYMPRAVSYLFDLWCREWEAMTLIKLEEVEYSKMWIRDVNNYLVCKPNGEIKAKGAYWYPKSIKDYDGVWNKDFSMMIVQKAIEQVLVFGWKPEHVMLSSSNPFDFMLRYKTPSGAEVYIGDKKMSKTVRYYVSLSGQSMKKVSTPKGEIGSYKRKNSITDALWSKVLSEIPHGTWDERIHTKNKSMYEVVTTSIESGRLIKCCNKASDFNWSDVDYDYYVQETKKLMIGEGHV